MVKPYAEGQQGAIRQRQRPATARNAMPTDIEKTGFNRLQQGVQFDATLKLVAAFPPMPKEVIDRFPEMAKHEAAVKEWHKALILALKGGQP